MLNGLQASDAGAYETMTREAAGTINGNARLWKIESDLYPLVADCAALLSDTPAFFLVNSYTTGAFTAACTVTATFAAATVVSIPTLGQWALMLLALMLGFGTWVQLRRTM